jgi:hypothetical protein
MQKDAKYQFANDNSHSFGIKAKKDNKFKFNGDASGKSNL